MSAYDFYITPEEYEAAEKNGISRQRLTVRVRQSGWDKRRAMTEPPQKQAPRSEWVDVAKANGILPGTFWERVKRLGWEPEKAAIMPLISTKDALKTASKTRQKFSDEIHALRESNGINYRTFINRVRDSGWDEYRAATEPVWTREQISKAGRASSKNNDFLFVGRNKR